MIEDYQKEIGRKLNNLQRLNEEYKNYSFCSNLSIFLSGISSAYLPFSFIDYDLYKHILAPILTTTTITGIMSSIFLSKESKKQAKNMGKLEREIDELNNKITQTNY